VTQAVASGQPGSSSRGPQGKRAAPWRRFAGAAAVLLVAAGMALILVAASSSDDEPARPSGALSAALADAQPASKPFKGLTAARIRVGDRTLHVVVTDQYDERIQGLRRRADIGPYDGMVFVLDAPTSTSFTMSTVKTPLAIGFYDRRGRVVDRLRMEPCPLASEARCARYQPAGEFLYALETLPGDLPHGRLASPR
jgi:uncharacterized membrane protein (UPF0127 family)